ncbi:putative high-affinity nicotinic acid transporter [Xylariomycetidae sp. FL2044]|nr:putative high-affinity nicotinic acid transporter [Xylariomycetidae sp. FL2044]
MAEKIDKKDVVVTGADDLEKMAGITYTMPTTDLPVVAIDESHAAEYEDYQRLKARFEADPKAMKRIIRLLDLRILPYLFLYYLLNSLDKSNAGNVKIYTFLQDTNMTSRQFNLALTWYFFTYAGLEAPSNMMMKKYGARLWLSMLVTGWGAVTLGTAWVKSYGDFCAARIMLGFFEAGLFQGCFYTISTWYLPGELQTRCAWWYSATMLSGAFGGLLAYAVGPLQGHLGLKQWQYLFIIEGSLTIFFGLLGFWLCPDFPERWSSSWFKPDEMKYLQLRIKYKDGPAPPDYTFKWSTFWEAVKDWKTYFIASLLAFGGSVPTYSVNYTLATMVKNLGYSSIKAQAMTSPPYVFAFFCVILIALYSDKYQCRARSLLISYAVGTIGVIILWPTLHNHNLSGVSYFALFLVVAGFNMQAPAVGSWLGTNVRNPTKRAAAMGWQSTWGQLFGGCIGANIFVDSEAPTYTTGFTILIVLVVVGGWGACIGNWYCLRASNLKKDRIPPEELVGKYTEEELTKMGEYSPFFRYTL